MTQERDERPTIEEVKDARLGSVVLEPSTADNKVKLRFSIEETDDLTNWTKRPWGHVISLPLETGKKFYRFSLENE